MNTNFNRKDLVDFGNQMIENLQKEGRGVKSVTHADVENWLYKKQQERNLTSIRAKLRCEQVIHNKADTEGEDSKQIVFRTFYEDGDDSNSDFASYTPSADASLLINEGTKAFDHFEEGEFYFLDFKKVIKS